jgi:hypothetical protein
VKSIFPIALLLIASFSMAGNVEEPQWQLIDTLDGVELRQYAPSVQARTELGSSGDTSAGFRRLAGFIFGGNDEKRKIAMTAPVEETLQESRPVMAFTMPSAYAVQDLPMPDDASITITAVPERKVAAISFSGWATQGKIASKSRELLSVLERHGIQTVGGTSLNQYNPPWTPPFLRRNEIVVEVGGIAGLASSQ